MRCEDFYKKFAKEGNFCEKSPVASKQIMEYIDYRKRHEIDGLGINFNALEPLMKIEGEFVHDMAMENLKNRLDNKLRPKDVTRKLMLEIIKTEDEKIVKGDPRRLKKLPDARRFIRNEYELHSLRLETRKMFGSIRKQLGFKTNDECADLIFRFVAEHVEEIKEFKNKIMMEKDIKIVDIE